MVPSKIFEHCIFPFLSNLPSSHRQFGFKKGVGCCNAISEVRKTIQYFNKRGNTVSVALVDVKKAFDKVSIWGVLKMLQRNCVNSTIIDVLEHWFSSSSACVKWNNTVSKTVSLCSGVRQGGILSPLLFAAYIDVVLTDLEKSSVGCFVNKRCFNSFLYADDLILLSISVSDLQSLINSTLDTFRSLDLLINVNKTVCLRIGNRCLSPCSNIAASGHYLCWVEEAKYLGVVIKRAKNFVCNWQSARSSFYKAVNGILSVLGANPSIPLVLALVRASCFPILLFGLEAVSLSHSDLNNLAFAYNNIFFKLFHVKDISTIEQCQYFCNFWPLRLLHDFRRFSFLSQYFEREGGCSIGSPDYPDYLELIDIAKKFKFNFSDSKPCLKFKVWNYLESSLF